MGRIRIVTDSSAHLRPGVAARLGISVVPQNIHLGGVTYREGVDITPKEFFQKMAATTEMPTWSPPSVETIANLYWELSRKYDEIISLHVSSELSGTCEAARVAAQTLLGRCKIVVIDSLAISLGLGILVEAAAEAAAKGAQMDEIVRLIRGMIPHIYMVFLTDALEYQERAKRLRPSQAVLGVMLGIKPLLTLEDGRIIPMEKVRTRAQGVEKLLAFVAEFMDIEELAILQSNFSEDTALLLEGLELLYPDWDVPVFTYGPSLATHLGPNALGVVIYERF